ncbi:hypothetical protein [Ensifer sp. B1-9]|uniref:hypothetical protein n=1 Tax=Ensifer sp. B1-9 TaxID=3141455 RepID=UPI003D196351
MQFIEFDHLARFVTEDQPRELVRAKFLASGELAQLLEENPYSVEAVAAHANIDPETIERLLLESALDVDLEIIQRAVAAVRFMNDAAPKE